MGRTTGTSTYILLAFLKRRNNKIILIKYEHTSICEIISSSLSLNFRITILKVKLSVRLFYINMFNSSFHKRIKLKPCHIYNGTLNKCDIYVYKLVAVFFNKYVFFLSITIWLFETQYSFSIWSSKHLPQYPYEGSRQQYGFN